MIIILLGDLASISSKDTPLWQTYKTYLSYRMTMAHKKEYKFTESDMIYMLLIFLLNMINNIDVKKNIL
jgi:hypothetical protein